MVASARVPVGVLDVSPVVEGSTSGEALRNTIDLATVVDRLGYHRYWLAEHHGMDGIASAAPEVLIGHVASATQHLRVGAGGIMLPNHAPLKVAEVFRVLEALHPGRIDLGLGRAPGTDAVTAAALRGGRRGDGPDDFPQQLGELLAFGGGVSGVAFGDDHPYGRIKTAPSDVALPPIWLLSSSGYGAGVSAQLGLGFAWAHHISSAGVVEAMRAYRDDFEPSAAFPEPHSILATMVVCGQDDEHATMLASSMELSWARLATGGRGRFPSPEEALAHEYTPQERALVQQRRDHSIVGGPETVGRRLEGLLDATGADELMVITMVFDHQERIASYERVAKVLEIQPPDVKLRP
jgi:luciferase family oxidoreductase group 1